jgi:hypothetical protein
MQHSVVRSTVVHSDPHQQVVGRRLPVLHRDVEVPVAGEDPGVDQLVLGILLAPPRVGGDQVHVRELGLRVLVEHREVRRRGRGVKVEVALLDVLAVVALGVGQPEKPFLEDGIVAVPQTQRQAEPLLVIADSGQPVLAPPIRTGTGVIVGKRGPRVAAAVVLAHCPPLPLAEIRPPLPPSGVAPFRLGQPLPFRVSHARLASVSTTGSSPSLAARRAPRLTFVGWFVLTVYNSPRSRATEIASRRCLTPSLR